MKHILLLIIVTFSFVFSYAQETPKDSTKTYKIELNDGSVFIGKILSETTEKVIIKTSSIPRIELDKKSIKTIEDVDSRSLKSGKYWFPNSNATRYLVGPSAIPLKKKEGYYQNTYILLNSFNVGLNNNISIGGGLEILSLFSQISGSPTVNFYLTPKAGFKISESLYLGCGALHINTRQRGPYYYLSSTREYYRQSFNIFYGSITLGNIENNFTLSSGFTMRNYVKFEEEYSPYGYVTSYTSERVTEFESRPIITFSGMIRAGKRISLVSENWVVPTSNDYIGMFSYAARILGEKTSFDIGFINGSDISEFFLLGIPYLDVVVKF
jgi:hypothetical protein